MDIPLLPSINAVFNTASAVCLVLGLRAKRHGNFARHGILMAAALAFSASFLVGYIYFHFFENAQDRNFTGPSWMRYPYLLMLASHILLAVVNLPLVLWAFYLGKRHLREQHLRVTRFAWPIWMYVSVTGVLIYVILYVWAPGYAHSSDST